MKVCEITGKVAVIGNNVSHSHHKTKRKFSPNLKNKRFWSEEEGRWITLKVSAAGIMLRRVYDHGGRGRCNPYREDRAFAAARIARNGEMELGVSRRV